MNGLKREDKLLELAKITYETLNTRDVRGADIAKKIDLKPAKTHEPRFLSWTHPSGLLAAWPGRRDNAAV